MTRNEEELSRDEHADQRVLVDCIKNDSFPKEKFVLGEDEWDVGGVIFKDCIKCCRGRIGLQTMTHFERHSHTGGENTDESAEQEDAEEGAGSETECNTHGHAEQIHRCVSQSRGGVGEVKVISNTLQFLTKTCVDFV